MNALNSPAAWLEYARRLIFSLGVDDGATRLCVANMTYGLAKINYVLTQLGYPPDALFIGTPDMTITRNTARWQAGFGYGGKLQWGAGDRPVFFLDVKPNACGMLVGGLSQLPHPQEVIDRLNNLKARGVSLHGIPLSWDFARGNHFIDLCRVQPTDPNCPLPPYAFVIHGSCPELQGENPLGPGLYWDHSPTLQRLARLFPTPWGPLHVLLDEAVTEYLAFWHRADQFACERRVLAAQACFGDFQLLCNRTHQGLHHANAVLLGCHDSQPPDGALLPMMIRSDLPGYLFQGLPNLVDSVIDSLGFRERALELGVLRHLQRANVIPHGAGYALPHLRDVRRVLEVGDRRYFEMTTITNEATELIDDLHDVQQHYRDRQPVLRTLECGLGRLVACLTPIHAIKA